MDEQLDLDSENLLSKSLPIGSDLNFTGDRRPSYPQGAFIDIRFRVVRELGRGGTGTVYQVEHVILRKDYAMKVLDPVQLNDESWPRFQKEAMAASRLDHPGFVKVHDFGLIDNQIAYFTMDLVDGETLATRLRREGVIPVDQALPLFIQLCFALDYAQSKGVIHRDLKPSNIAIAKAETAEGVQVKILDFGIAKLVGLDTTSLTKVGAVFGTPFYMSPEQCMGQPVDSRSDIYSLGCVFFEALAGAPPFTNENALALMMQHQMEKPPTLREVSMGGQFSPHLEALVRKMLSKNPQHRYQRLLDAANDLIDLQQGKVPGHLSASKGTESVTPRKVKPRLVLFVSVVIGSLVLIAGTAIFMLWRNSTLKGSPSASIATSPTHIALVPMVDETFDKKFDEKFTAAKFFSTPKIENGISYRVFNFPSAESIGEVKYRDITTNKLLNRKAIGQLTIACQPGEPCIVMRLGYNMCNEKPHYLKKFRPDEIGELSFDDNDYRKHMLPDDIYDNTLSFIDDLKSIYLIELPAPVTDASIEHLSKLSHLEFLGLARTQITGEGLRKLPQLPHLKSLRMSMIKDAHIALPALRHSKSLKTLKMADDDLRDSDLKNISGIKSLEILALRDNPKITDAGLNHLTELPNLRELSLDGCKITPHAIKTLSSMNIRESLSLDVSQWAKPDVDLLLSSVKCDVQSWNAKANRSITLRPSGNGGLGGKTSGIVTDQDDEPPRDPIDRGE